MESATWAAISKWIKKFCETELLERTLYSLEKVRWAFTSTPFLSKATFLWEQLTSNLIKAKNIYKKKILVGEIQKTGM